jgi:hypothetical protein
MRLNCNRFIIGNIKPVEAGGAIRHNASVKEVRKEGRREAKKEGREGGREGGRWVQYSSQESSGRLVVNP